MTTITDLQTSIMTVVQNDNFSIADLEKVLTPIPLYVNNTVFTTNINSIIAILTTDRDGNNVFTYNDLVLFSQDISAMSAFITSLLLILNSIPNVTIDYNTTDTEQLIFIFLVIIPAETKVPLTLADKTSIVNIGLIIYDFLINSTVLKNLVNKVLQWFETKCTCLASSNVTKMAVLHKRLPTAKKDLLLAIKK
jgi:hypothetical protein